MGIPNSRSCAPMARASSRPTSVRLRCVAQSSYPVVRIVALAEIGRRVAEVEDESAAAQGGQQCLALQFDVRWTRAAVCANAGDA